MEISIPTKTEMLNRTRNHRAFRQDSDTVNLLWKGYLTALYEWELFPEQEYRDVISELKPVGDSVIAEQLFEFSAATLTDTQFPTNDEIIGIIRRSLKRHGNSPAAHLIWRGYLAGMMEWIWVFHPDDYYACDDKLSQAGEDERSELFGSFDDDDDDEEDDR